MTPIITDDEVNELRRIACRAISRKLGREYTLEEHIEAERNVCWPSEVIPETLPPAELAMSRMRRGHVPDLYIAHVGMKAPRDCQALRYVRQWMAGQQSFLVLSGGPGTCKTGSAAWAMSQVDRGQFIDAQHIVRTRLEDRDRWDRINAATLLVLDDLGVEKADGKGMFSECVSELVTGVYEKSHRRMIVTCNLTPEQFKQNYGARLYDRLKESGSWAAISGESVRGTHWLDREPGSDDDDDFTV